MATMQQAFKRAKSLGATHGAEAASWYWDRTDPGKADYQRVLKGIKDGDPEILDTFTHSPLSGEMADSMTPKLLWEELGLTERQIGLYGDDVCTTYEQAFGSSYEDLVAEQCRSYLETEVIVRINAQITEEDDQTLKTWLAAISDTAAKNNLVSINDVSAETEEDGVVW
jgi:hypothetical protein